MAGCYGEQWGQDQDSDCHRDRDQMWDQGQVSGLDQVPSAQLGSGTGLPFLGIKDEKMPVPPGHAVGSRMLVCGSVGLRHLVTQLGSR